MFDHIKLQAYDMLFHLILFQYIADNMNPVWNMLLNGMAWNRIVSQNLEYQRNLNLITILYYNNAMHFSRSEYN